MFEFHGTPDERRAQGEMLMTQVYRDLYGNGTPGILSRIEASLTKTATEDAMRQKQHTENLERNDRTRNRLNIIIAILIVLSGYLALFKGHF